MDVLMPCYSDSEGQHRISLERGITSIGRSPNQDIVMSDLSISRNHAVIACAPYLNCDEILEKVAKFSATNPAQDDCTLLELKYMRDASIPCKSRFNQAIRVASRGSWIRRSTEHVGFLYPGYGPTLTASGVAMGTARPMNFETVLLPEFAVQTQPEASTATPVGLLREPKPVSGDSGVSEL